MLFQKLLIFIVKLKGNLMVYFIIYLFIEVMLSSYIANSIGGLYTFIAVIISALIGIGILKNFKFSLSENIAKARTGQMTQEDFIKTNAGKALGAVFLILPGFFTDTLGLMMQFPFLVIMLSKVFKFQTPSNKNIYSNFNTVNSVNFEYEIKDSNNMNNKNYKKSDDIIDVEIIEDNKSLKD